jgi:putative methyltransferase (TIGR04325 family)
MSLPKSIWSGVFRSFSEVAGSSAVFDDAQWVNKLGERLDRQIAEGPSYTRDYPLAVAASMLACRGRPLRIIDVGGGIGATLLAVADALPNADVEGHVVEKNEICKEGRRRLSDRKWLNFHDQFPHLADVDIVHFGSTLHYIEHWRKVLSQAVSCHPNCVVISELPAGNIETFVTAQHYYGSSIPVWFFNRAELIETMRSLEFSLVYEAPFQSKFFGREMTPPMDALPPEFRLLHLSNFIFRPTNALKAN